MFAHPIGVVYCPMCGRVRQFGSEDVTRCSRYGAALSVTVDTDLCCLCAPNVGLCPQCCIRKMKKMV